MQQILQHTRPALVQVPSPVCISTSLPSWRRLLGGRSRSHAQARGLDRLDGRLPDFILELLSRKTARNDRTVKKDLYARVFGTSEYFLYDPRHRTLEGFRLAAGAYRPLTPDARGRLWSEQLGAFLGLWHGTWEGREDDWVRLFRPDGSLVPIRAEAERQRAETERQRAEAERQRADQAEAELARLRALLDEREAG